MNYNNPNLRERLAAEYALGTLAGPARRRFERLVRRRADWRAELEAWQARLGPLAEAVTAVEPPAHVWTRIAQRAGLETAHRPAPEKPSLWGSLGFWRGFAGLAAASAFGLLVVVGVLRQAPDEVPTVTLAVLADEVGKGQPVMVVTAEPKSHTVSVTLLTEPAIAPDRDLELWAVPDGKDPVSLGVIKSRGQTVFRLSDPDAAMVRAAKALAISLEPKGGSPTGKPTEVLYVGGVIPKRT